MSSFLEASSSQAPHRQQKEKEKKEKKKRTGKGALAALGIISATGGRPMTAAAFPTETTASQCPRKKPRPALPGDLEAWSSRGPLAQPPVWSPGTASSKQQAGRAAAPEQQNQGFGRNASSQNVITKEEECLKEMEELKFEIQKCQCERDELYQILDLYIYDEWDHRLHVELPVLQSEHEMRMMAMQMMTNSISDAMERYKELIQVNSSYRIRHSQLLREQAQLKNNIQILLNEKRELLVEQTERPASSVETKGFCEEAEMNICDPSAKQQQV